MTDVESDSAFTQQKPAKNYARFYPLWVRNKYRSQQEGKEVGEYQDFVLIVSPGQSKTEVHVKATDAHKHEYPQEWADYKAGRDQRISGTPIELLPGLDKGRADAMKALYIYSIEQLSELSQPAQQKLGMGSPELVQRAQAYLQNKNAAVVVLEQQLKQKDEEIAELKRQIAAFSLPRKVGRPKKIVGAV